MRALLARAPAGFRTVLVDEPPELGVVLLSKRGYFAHVQSGALQEFDKQLVPVLPDLSEFAILTELQGRCFRVFRPSGFDCNDRFLDLGFADVCHRMLLGWPLTAEE